MTMTDALADHALEILQDLDEDWAVICDIASKQGEGNGWPLCSGDPAEWVGWRVNCCPESPRYLLLCTHCKETYQRWFAEQGDRRLLCGWCEQDGGIVTFTELRKRS